MKNARIYFLILTFACMIFAFSCRSVYEHKEKENPDVNDVSEKTVEQIIQEMSTKDKITQMMFFCPRYWSGENSSGSKENITKLNSSIIKYLKERRFGGFLLYGQNCEDAEQVLTLTKDLCKATLDGGGIMPFISIDQEGGSVSRLNFGTAGVGNMAIAATGDVENSRKMAKVHGKELNLLGINVDLAPVLDVNDNPANPIIGVRSFGDDAEQVAKYGVAFMEGLAETETIACLKHFPGHGNTDKDSHTSLPLVDRSYAELLKNELVPFKAAIDAGAEMVMTAHIQYPQIEKKTYISKSGQEIYIPATMSKTILTDILRKDLGFDGLIVCDALDMRAISDNFKLDDILTLCINAGVNMLCMPSAFDWSVTDDLIKRGVKLVENGTIDISLIDESVRKILLLKEKYGLLKKTKTDLEKKSVEAAVKGCGSKEHRDISWKIAEKAITLLKNKNDAFPLKVQKNETVLIFVDFPSRSAIGDFSRQLLEKMNALPEGVQIKTIVVENTSEQKCIAEAKLADHVILISRSWDATCLNPNSSDGARIGIYNNIIDELHSIEKTAIVVSAQLPYDAACYPNADAILLTYWSSVMTSIPPESGTNSAWSPNLPAAICSIFGVFEPQGKLPVRMMGVGE